MVRFQLIDHDCWERWDEQNRLHIDVKFDHETTREITRQLCNGRDPINLEAAFLILEYNIRKDTLRFYHAALQEIDPKTGEPVDYPYGNETWVNDITLPLNEDERNYIKGNLPTILAQIEANEEYKRSLPPPEKSEWDYDYLR